jgi:hypothetical protein
MYDEIAKVNAEYGSPYSVHPQAVGNLTDVMQARFKGWIAKVRQEGARTDAIRENVVPISRYARPKAPKWKGARKIAFRNEVNDWWRALPKQDAPTAGARALLLVLIDFANPNTAIAWPALDTLVEVTGLSRHTVIAKVDELQDFGIIEVTRGRRGSGKSSTSQYRLLTDGEWGRGQGVVAPRNAGR